MKKTLAATLPIILLCTLLNACSSGKFKITAHIVGIGDGNVRIAYAAPDGVKSTWAMVKDNKFEVEGTSPQLTVVGIYDNGGRMMLRVAAQNGDNITIEGDIAQKNDLKVHGNKASEDWFAFMHDNADAYVGGNEPALCMKIEQYIKAHPADVASTLLLLCDYPYRSNTEKVDKLLGSIAPEAKPDFLLQTHKALARQHGTPITALGAINLIGTDNRVTTLSALGSKFTIMYFWNTDDASYAQNVTMLRSLADKAGSNLKIADIFIDADTMQWRSTINAAKAPWQHLWAPGGPVDNELKAFAIGSAATFVVADSSGKVAYNGTSAAQACQAAASAIEQ